MSLPPLAPIPNLRRLLTPEETLLYTVRFHPLRGWPFLFGALGCLILSYYVPLAILPCAVLAILWYIPLMSNEVAVTNDRLLVRIGRFRLMMEAFDDASVMRWRVEQNALDVLLHTGRVVLRIREATAVREVTMNWVWHPMTLLEALQAMQDEQFRARGLSREDVTNDVSRADVQIPKAS